MAVFQQNLRRNSSSGFTLIEMITVIVLLGVMSGVLTPFISKAMQAYSASKARADLVSKGRLSMERMSREIRHVVPNSLRILGGGTGIEFVRSRTGGRYVSEFDTFALGFSNPLRRFKTGVSRVELYTVGTGLNFVANDLLVIGNTTPSLLEAGTTTVALTSITPTTLLDDNTVSGQVLNFAAKTFTMGSPGKHFVIADQTIEVGLNGTNLHWYASTGLSEYDNAQDWSSVDPMLVNGVNAVIFSYSAGASMSSGVLRIDLELIDSVTNETIRLYQEVHMRNTP